ncbi:hypothetical protein B0H19DRAFT_1250740 [Mycena capillaripes]|nr:hypothetical protein B0H19DRAFT_1250740 [Mycena capillaripes]
MCSPLPFPTLRAQRSPVYVFITITLRVRAEDLQAIVVTERDVVTVRELESDVEGLVARIFDDEDVEEQEDDDEKEVDDGELDLQERGFDEDIRAHAAKKAASTPVKKLGLRPVRKT